MPRSPPRGAIAVLLAVLFTSSLAAAETPPSSILATTEAEPSIPAPAALPSADDSPHTLIGPDDSLRESGWYVAPSFGITGIDGHVGYLSGLRGAWVMNRTFGIGLAANGFGGKIAGSDSLTTQVDRRIAGGDGGGAPPQQNPLLGPGPWFLLPPPRRGPRGERQPQHG